MRNVIFLDFPKSTSRVFTSFFLTKMHDVLKKVHCASFVPVATPTYNFLIMKYSCAENKMINMIKMFISIIIIFSIIIIIIGIIQIYHVSSQGGLHYSDYNFYTIAQSKLDEGGRGYKQQRFADEICEQFLLSNNKAY